MKHRPRFHEAALAATILALTVPAGQAATAALPAAAAAPAAAPASAAATAQVPVETLKLDNGMTILMVRKPEKVTVAAGWVAHVGSANEHPGITGISHLFEHMMFKGTSVVGTKNIKRDLEIIDEQEKIQEQIRAIYRDQRLRARRGDIEDPFDPGTRPPELIELEKKFQALVDEQRSIMNKDEFDQIFTKAGATGINAFTNTDITVYFLTVPANKLELWFWMESDRLANRVFREFYSERDVVHEERRLRTESTPTGKFDELFEAMFWEAHPYHWPVVGWPSDLKTISKSEADAYYDTYYSPNNITVALVGNFELADAKALAQKYFGRLKRGAKPPPDVVTLEMPQLAEKRMTAECDCQPQINVAYHAVAFRHKDSYALDVLAGLMNGQTGRLQKSLVLDKKIATSASTNQDSRKWAGMFTFSAETKGDATPEQLEAAWNDELKKIVEQPIPAEELQKVKNQIQADAFRRLDNPFFLLIQLLVYDGLGDWTYLQDWSQKTMAVTADDVKRVAKTYLSKENRTTGLYYRKAGTGAEAPPSEMADVPPDLRPMVQAQLKALKEKLAGITDPKEIESMLEKVRAQKEQAPDQLKKVIPMFERAMEDRLKALKGAPAPEGGK